MGMGPIELGRGEKLSSDELKTLPIFADISKSILDKNAGAVVRRSFKKGEIICREGEHGSTAYYILEGSAEVFISTPMAHVKTGRFTSFMLKMKSMLVGWREDPRVTQEDRLIGLDASVDVSTLNPRARLKAGELFGEMTCMSRYPRSATVQAAEDCVMLEMLGNILAQLLKSKTFKAQAEATYRERALDNHLRSVPIFKGLSDDFLNYLRDRVELVRHRPGDVIFHQGDEPDAFYIVRIGFVKVSRSSAGGELVLAYRPRGAFIGEMGLLEGTPRSATCTAIDDVELVRIPKDQFVRLTEEFPSIRAKLEEAAALRKAETAARERVAASVPLDKFLDQGLMEAQNLLLLDLDSCTRCDECVRACASAHDGITRLVRDGLRFDKYLVATSCRSCRDPVCMVGCPVGSIRRKESLEIIIEDWCIGCGLCAKNCPYGNINIHPFEVSEADPDSPGRQRAVVKKKATTCDLCTSLSEPACVSACPHEAAMRVNPSEFFASEFQPLEATGPQEGDAAPES